MATINGIGVNSFYSSVTTTNLWVEVPFDFQAHSQMFINDSANATLISYDGGTTTHGQIETGESITFEKRHNISVWMKSASDGNAAVVRVFAW